MFGNKKLKNRISELEGNYLIAKNNYASLLNKVNMNEIQIADILTRLTYYSEKVDVVSRSLITKIEYNHSQKAKKGR